MNLPYAVSFEHRLSERNWPWNPDDPSANTLDAGVNGFKDAKLLFLMIGSGLRYDDYILVDGA
jgi:hypothetical protein